MNTTINTADKTIVLAALSTKGKTLSEIVATESAARIAALAASLESAPSIPAAHLDRVKTTQKKDRTPMPRKTALAPPHAGDAPVRTRVVTVTIDGSSVALSDSQRDMVLAVLDGKITPRAVKSRQPATPRTPRSTRPTTCTVIGVDEALGNVTSYEGRPYDGTHEFLGWSAQYLFTTRLCQVLKSAGVRTSGNYKKGVWSAVHTATGGKQVVVSITGDVPAASLTSD